MKKTVAAVPVSVVIVTRNRASALAKCLESLAVQTVKPTELLVIDNASSDATAEVVATFTQKTQWHVRRVVESKLGYPVVYNRGIRESKKDWVIFIDDDCVAVPLWLESFWKKIQKFSKKTQPQIAALVGNSETQQPATVWALAVLAADQFWKHSVVTKVGKVLDLETLDNKNIAYFKPFLTKHKLSFNEAALREPGNGAAEDADLGMQLQSVGATALFVTQAQIFHQDPNALLWYYRRLLSGARANFYYQKRWKKFREKAGLIALRQRARFRDFWPDFCQRQNLTGTKKIMAFGIIWLSFKLTHLWRRYWNYQTQ